MVLGLGKLKTKTKKKEDKNAIKPTKQAEKKAAVDAGKREEIKPGFIMEEVAAADGQKSLVFTNNTRDKQFIVSCEFTGDAAPSAQAKQDGAKIVLSVHPSETLTMATGSWKKFKKGTKSGPCDAKWLEQQKGVSDAGVKKDLDAVKNVLRAKGITRVTAEATAAACADAGVRFVDVTFPPKDASLKKPTVPGKMKMYPWKRPETYLEGTGLKPSLFVGDVEPDDIDQGALADCYLMGALTAVAEFERLVVAMFENGQDPDQGCYKLSLCKNGWWQTVIVDDFLPCAGVKPAYARNRDEPNELWVSLAEKAYAKLHGSYFAIKQGGAGPAMADITGCPFKLVEFTGEDMTSFDQLLENDMNEFLQVLGTPGKNLTYVDEAQQKPEDKALFEKYKAVGLVCEHSYPLLSVVRTSKGDELCFIRNPWGNDIEWNGKWSDNDTASWTPELKEEVGFQASSNGAFWMAYDDVKKWFGTCAINYCYGTWDQIRCAGNFENGATDLVIQITCKEDTSIFFGLHQKDPRGIEEGVDAKLVGLALYVVKQKKAGGKVFTHVQTGTKQRDAYHQAALEKGTTYYFYGQPKEAGMTKSHVLSMLVQDKNSVDVAFLTAKAKRYDNPKEFAPEHWKATEAIYQIKGQFSTMGALSQRTGRKVDFSGAAEAALANEHALFRSTIAADKKRGVTGPAATLLTLEVTIESGKGLAAKDDNGLSDPYCEVKVRETQGEKVAGCHRHPQKQVTTVQYETLNPTWNQKFAFMATATDAIRVHCFDKDEIGKDALGHVHVKLADLLKQGLAPGKNVSADYKLTADPGDGVVTGTLKVGVKLVKKD
eukprot:TRINITY_DN1768_c1_g6_i1.p1 TRINITY_DN1768_c1_g6~~TRINITY_DN1768_c1_g6_i1.p1  ORF type:complete len:827 (+),score=395.27 TRINITY_DN1768_c1_g6_i1:64-2544(+)